jgi:hypothetical protein
MNHEDFLGFLVFGLSRGTVPPHHSRGAGGLGEQFPVEETRTAKPKQQSGLQTVITAIQHLFGREAAVLPFWGLGRPTPRV